MSARVRFVVLVVLIAAAAVAVSSAIAPASGSRWVCRDSTAVK